MERIELGTPDLTRENLNKLAELFPQVLTEAMNDRGEITHAVDVDALRDLVGEVVEGPRERYQFTWPGKREAKAEARRPISKTMRPVIEDSVNWDDTQNLYIEGDNLDALKILKETYAGKVKLIYIDPPYNTGNDFVYDDDFTMTHAEYIAECGDYSEVGRLVANPESSGRFHSDWCSMMYPRLKLARELMARNGIIFVSIDDAEVSNLKALCNEVFGAHNFVACLVYDRNRKNDAKYYSVGHEYMLVYFKDANHIAEKGIIWRAAKEGVDDVREKFNELKGLFGNDWETVTREMRAWYATWDESDPRKPLARFAKVDEQGPYRDDGNISWPGGGGPKYEVLHPVTGRPCKVPDAGWRFPRFERMQEEIDKGRVVFGPDETTLPRIRRNLFESDGQVLKSVKFSYAQTATVEFNKIFDNKRVFDNPKSLSDIEEIISYVTADSRDAVILDFFSGSATTAHALFEANREDGGSRRFILVQLPEQVDEKSEAAKAGYPTICEIGKERIRRAGRKIAEEVAAANRQLKLGEEPKPIPDIGFRVLRIESSNFKDTLQTPEETGQQMLLGLSDNVKEGRTGLDLLFEVLPKFRIPYSAKIEERAVCGKRCFIVWEGDIPQLVACFDVDVEVDTIEEIAKMRPIYAVMRDASMADDATHANFEELFKTYSPETIRRVI